ncbi:MAG: tetratricopeptide repeat protein [Terriglobia bacterium]
MQIRKEASSLLVVACLLLLAPMQRPSNAPSSILNQEFLSAVSLYRKGQYARSQQILVGLLGESPDNFELNELMGLVCKAQGNAGEAEKHFASAVRQKPGSAEARMYWASSLIALRHYSRAEQEFEAAVRLQPFGYDTNHNLGEFYLAAGKVSSAIPYLQKAQQADPSSLANGHDLALAEIRTGRVHEAKLTVDHLLSVQRSRPSADLVSLIAAVDEKSGQYVAAAKEYQVAAQMSPTEGNMFAWGGDLLLHHALAPAEQVFEQGARLYPNSLRLQIGLGIASYSLNYYKAALAAFSNAISLSPNDPRPYKMLMMIYDISPANAPGVTQSFAHFAALEPHNPNAAYFYALCLAKQARVKPDSAVSQKAESLLRTAIAADPGFADAHLQLGIQYWRQHQIPEAIAQYEQAIVHEPSLADAHFRLAAALVRAGKRDQARREFQTFSRLKSLQSKQKRLQRSAIADFEAILTSPGK